MNSTLQLKQPEIDYGFIPAPEAPSEEDWEPPRRVFFGKRDQNTGKMEKEKPYRHQDFPSMMYKLVDGKIRATLVHAEQGFRKMLADGWETTPEAFGYVGAPSQDQLFEAEAASRAAAETAAANAAKTAAQQQGARK